MYIKEHIEDKINKRITRLVVTFGKGIINNIIILIIYPLISLVLTSPIESDIKICITRANIPKRYNFGIYLESEFG